MIYDERDKRNRTVPNYTVCSYRKRRRVQIIFSVFYLERRSRYRDVQNIEYYITK